MEKSNKRGKIPQTDWPLIMARYDAGETLASIARTYDCSPPAISYVVSRSRARRPAEALGGSDKTLVKTEAAAVATRAQRTDGSRADSAIAAGNEKMPAPVETPAVHPEAAGGARLFRPDGHEAPRHAGERQAALPLAGDAVAPPRGGAAISPVNGDQRRRLHLSLGNGGHLNGNGSGSGVHGNGAASAHHQQNGTHSNAAAAPIAHPNGERYHRERDNGDGATALPHGASPIHPDRPQPAPDRGRDGAVVQKYQPPAEEAPRKEGTRTIDRELRARVDSDIAAFLAAFDAALAQDTQEHRSALREATDRLLRAGARTRIELERLEARVPLPRRDLGGPGEPASRYR